MMEKIPVMSWAGRSDAFARVSDHVAALIGAREGAAVIALRGKGKPR
jgi:hypothetical protein